MPAYVLIHGSAQNASCWDRVRPRLRGEVITPELPADRRDWTASEFARFVADQTPDGAVVVAHSASGILLPLIAQMRPVRSLVYLAAMIPEPGSTALEQFEREPDMLPPEWVQAGRAWSDRANWNDLADWFLFHDVDPVAHAWAHSTLRVMRTDGILRQRISSPIAPVPSLFILCNGDRTINPQWQHRTWLEVGSGAFVVLDAGHCPHVSKPDETAKVINLAGSDLDDRALMAADARDRRTLFAMMSAQRKADFMRSRLRAMLDAKRSELSREQIATIEEAMSLVRPALYEPGRHETDARLEELTRRMESYFSITELAAFGIGG